MVCSIDSNDKEVLVRNKMRITMKHFVNDFVSIEF